MAVDKLVDSTQLDTDLTAVANAIRTKGGTSAQMAFPAGFVSAVQAIPTGGGGGVVISNTTFKIKNSRASGSMNCIRISYNAYSSGTSGLGCYSDGNTSNGATSDDKNAALFDDAYIVIHTNYNVNSITYNGEPVAYTTAGSGAQWDVHITLPSGFDNSYPLKFT